MKNSMQFFSEVRLELAKVVWPKYEEWIGSTIIVLVIVSIFSVYLGVVDFGFAKLANFVFKTFSLY